MLYRGKLSVKSAFALYHRVIRLRAAETALGYCFTELRLSAAETALGYCFTELRLCAVAALGLGFTVWRLSAGTALGHCFAELNCVLIRLLLHCITE